MLPFFVDKHLAISAVEVETETTVVIVEEEVVIGLDVQLRFS